MHTLKGAQLCTRVSDEVKGEVRHTHAHINTPKRATHPKGYASAQVHTSYTSKVPRCRGHNVGASMEVTKFEMCAR